MNNPPQKVTERYIGNLIRDGRNREFDIIQIKQEEHVVDNEPCGIYFKAVLTACHTTDARMASGATLNQAVRRCLEKYGVTFR